MVRFSIGGDENGRGQRAEEGFNSDSYSHGLSEEEDGQEEQVDVEELRANGSANSTPNVNGHRAPEPGQLPEIQQGRICVTVEPDLLDCPICTEPLIPPVYQCDNGHVACKSCCKKMRNKCGSCCLPIGYNRCRALEKVIDSILVPCSYKERGCVESISYGMKFDHEKRCIYGPCLCPVDGCSHSDFYKDLLGHLSVEHPSSYQEIHLGGTFTFPVKKFHPDRAFAWLKAMRTNVVLLEKNERIVFVLGLSPCINPKGLFGFVACIAPKSSERVFYYELAAEVGNSTMKARAWVENDQRWEFASCAKQRMIVPNEFITSEPIWKLTIWRGKPAARKAV